jgi:hypothetical protein
MKLPYIRSAWPTPIGKRLTNRMIAKYKKLGFYSSSIMLKADAKATRAKRVKERALPEFV